MNDEELAQGLVVLGVIQRGEFETPDGTVLYYLTGETAGGKPIQEIVRDWRVAGAMMEKCRDKGIGILIALLPDDKVLVTCRGPITDPSQVEKWDGQRSGDNEPRTINAACAEALENDST